MSIDRFIHLCAGIVFFYGFMRLNASKPKMDHQALFLGLTAMAFGTWVPDWDLFLGIGFHRNPLTHSFLPAVLVGWIVFKYKLPIFLMIGFSLGLSSHLFWDIIAYGNVHWIPGGNYDRMYLLVNSVASMIAAIKTKGEFFKQKTNELEKSVPAET